MSDGGALKLLSSAELLSDKCSWLKPRKVIFEIQFNARLLYLAAW